MDLPDEEFETYVVVYCPKADMLGTQVTPSVNVRSGGHGYKLHTVQGIVVLARGCSAAEAPGISQEVRPKRPWTLGVNEMFGCFRSCLTPPKSGGERSVRRCRTSRRWTLRSASGAENHVSRCQAVETAGDELRPASLQVLVEEERGSNLRSFSL